MRRLVALLVMLFAAAALALTLTGPTSPVFADNGVISSHNGPAFADNGVINSRN